MRILSTLLLFLCCASVPTLAQKMTMQEKVAQINADQILVIELTDGTTMVGKVVGYSDTGVDVQTTLGVLTVPFEKIRHIEIGEDSAMKDGTYWFPSPNRTRLFLAPTGRSLAQGEGYYQNIYLFFNGFALGVTDNLTLGGGMSIFPVDDFLNDNVFYLTPKIGADINRNISASVGAIILRSPGLDETVGLAYGVLTAGNDRGSVTGALGFGFAGNNLSDAPVLVIGGDYRLSRRTAFVTENWFFPTEDVDGGVISYGIRFFGEKISVDLALFNLTEDALFPGLPYVDFVINF